MDACYRSAKRFLSVIPAKAGIHFVFGTSNQEWVPAFAGTTGMERLASRQ
jgi:hypothetical protein